MLSVPPSPIGASARRVTREVAIGPLAIGAGHPVLIQSMTIADTMDTDAVVAEIRQLVEAGCPLVRVTAPHVPAAENLREIKRRLRADRIDVPLVADIHFTPKAALVAAEIVEKVRINPGNYADRKRFAVHEYSDSEYESELQRLRETFLPLVRRCQETGAAMRIGTNHGSLSDRIMNRFGDTPEGMVESALEFARICGDAGYHRLVFSMKSSIPSVMIAAYRLLVARMDALGMSYPIHLGVTEAGDGLEARIKSAIGIGSLLVDGIGDTIRVSLTEDSIHELPAARAILESAARQQGTTTTGALSLDTRATRPRRATGPWMLGSLTLGGAAPVRVEQAIRLGDTPQVLADVDLATLGEEGGAEFLSLAWPGLWPELSEIEAIRAALADGARSAPPLLLEAVISDRADLACLDALLGAVEGASVTLDVPEAEIADIVPEIALRLLHHRRPLRFRLGPEQDPRQAAVWSDLARGAGLNTLGHVVSPRPDWIVALRALRAALGGRDDLLFLEVPHPGPDAALLAGAALTDGLGDALALIASDRLPWPPSDRRWRETSVESAYAILQAARLRLTKAEFIACPSCGRTMFDLQTTTARIQRRTGHLKGVKIAVMGCIVNGPGEMADADFGYVGSGPGKVDLYVSKERVRQGVPEAEAEDRLVELIRGHGRWIDLPTPGPEITRAPSPDRQAAAQDRKGA